MQVVSRYPSLYLLPTVHLSRPWLGAAVGGTVLVQGDIAAVTGVVIVYTNVATLVLYKPTFLLTAGLTDADSKEEEEQ